MKTVLSIFTMLLTLTLVTSSFATTVDDLLKDPNLDANTRQRIVDTINRQSNTVDSIINNKNLDRWREFGDAFAETIKKICQTLNVEVNTFLKSDVGKLTAALIVYKMVGHDILRVIIYGSSLFMITIICGLFSKYAFIKKKVKDKQTKEVQYIEMIEWEDTEAKYVAMFITALIWVISTWAILVNII